MSKDALQGMNEAHARLDEHVRATEAALHVLLEEREKRFIERLAAEEDNRSIAISALETRMTDAIVSSDKAVTKAEDAQRDYNIRSNEFRGQLQDQQQTFLTRSEAQGAFKSLEEKLLATQSSFEDKLGNLQNNIEKTMERNARDIVLLRESRSETSGRRVGSSELVVILVGIALVMATLFLAIEPVLFHK